MRKYAEIMQMIDQKVTVGDLKPGSKLPSIRALSEDFSCSKNTVIKAYQELENQHMIYSVPQSGYYVVENHPAPRKKLVEFIDFQSAGPDKELMPYLDFKHCLNQAIDRYQEAMFSYSDIQGLYSLRGQLAKHLQNLQVFTVPERIFVVTGSQQALHLLISMPFPNGKNTICVEQPTHPSMMESLHFQKAKTVGIEMTAAGPNLDQLEKIFKDHEIKFFYTVSRFHNPSGYSYTNAQRQRIVELAQKYDVYIVEDDYMGDLDANMKHDPMFAYDPSGRIIYTKSFSKVLLPGLRLGLVVLPEEVTHSFLQGKFASDVHTPVLTQGALEIYLKNGMFDAHIEKLKRVYRKKGSLLQRAYHEHLPPAASFSGSLSGFYSTIELPNTLKTAPFIEHLRQKNVIVDHTNMMYLDNFRKENVIRLSVSQVKEELISVGVQKISEGIQEMLKRRLN